MPPRIKRPCRHMGCSAVVNDSFGYCDLHQKHASEGWRNYQNGKSRQERGVPGKSGVHVSFCEINIYARSVDALASQHVQIPSTISLPRLTEERTMISIWRHCVGHAIEPRLQGSVSGETRPVSAWGGGDQILNPFRF